LYLRKSHEAAIFLLYIIDSCFAGIGTKQLFRELDTKGFAFLCQRSGEK
jgi:hypothetical protein